MSVNYSVLVVEPETELRETITRQLLRRGYNVTAVNHPRQALAVATFKDFAVAVVGAELPEIECTILVERLQRLIGDLKPIVVSDIAALPRVTAGVSVIERSLSSASLEQAILAAIHAPRDEESLALAALVAPGV